MVKKTLATFSPARTILLSVFATIIIGTLALALPIARTTSIAFIDLFFTATSATCVTGLFTVPLSNFTTFGHCIILALIQIGGLGLITLSLFLMYLFANLGFATQLMAGQLLEIEQWKHVKKILIFIIGVTLCTEFVGALCIFSVIKSEYSLPQALFLSIFHAVSSFCNAGISLFHGSHGSMHMYSENYMMLIITTMLVFIGGFGFIAWNEIMRYITSLHKKKRHHFSLHSKIILYGSATLISVAVVLIWLLEHNNAFAQMNPLLKFANALFHAVSFRSTGFMAIPLGDVQLATIFLMVILSFIGSSPGSTGSGVKITTFILFLATIKAAISGRTSVDIKGRSIAKDQIYKAIAIISLSVIWIMLTTFCLLITEKGWHFIDLFFEVTSAFATLGISTGTTPFLSALGKLFIIASMFVGRIGSLTLILALRKLALRKKTKGVEFLYPEERVMLS